MGGFHGLNIYHNYLNSCEAYNISKEKWKSVKSMNKAKAWLSATVVDNQFIYTFGGHYGHDALDSIEKYDIAKDIWELLEIKLNSPKEFCACF